jgi:hypothetical protein
VLIKPCASYPVPYPVTTSRDIIWEIVRGIREASDADIIILESAAAGGAVYPVYQALSYDFPRVLMLDVNDSIQVEVDNPLPKPFAVETFWVPNVILSSDYSISVTPAKVVKGLPQFSIMNLISLLPTSKYSEKKTGAWGALYSMGINKVAADLYFTLPFDLGIIDATQKFTGDDPVHGKGENYGKVFVGEPLQVDGEAAEALGFKPEYLNLIREARVQSGG